MAGKLPILGKIKNKSNSNIDPNAIENAEPSPNIMNVAVEGSGSLVVSKEKIKEDKKKKEKEDKERKEHEKAENEEKKKQEKEATKKEKEDKKKKDPELKTSKKDKFKNIATLGLAGNSEKKAEKRKSLTFKNEDGTDLKIKPTNESDTNPLSSAPNTPGRGSSVGSNAENPHITHTQSALVLPSHPDNQGTNPAAHKSENLKTSQNSSTTPEKAEKEKEKEKSKFPKIIGAPINFIESGVKGGVKGVQTVASGTSSAIGSVASGTTNAIGSSIEGVASHVPKLHRSATTIGDKSTPTEPEKPVPPTTTDGKTTPPPVVIKPNTSAIGMKEWAKDQVLGITHLIIVTFLCWVLGRLGFSFLWSILLLSAGYYLEKRWRIRSAERTVALLEIDRRKRRPHYVESVNWLQVIIDSWWPVATPSINSQIKTAIQKAISENVGKGGHFSGLVMENFTLGDVTPQILSVKGFAESSSSNNSNNNNSLGGRAAVSTGDLNAALATSVGKTKKTASDNPLEGSTITNIDIELDFPSRIEAKIVLKIGPASIPIILENLSISGKLRCELRVDDTPSGKMPFLQVISLAFKKPPFLKFSIRTLMAVDIMDLPGLESKLHEVLMNTITEKMVLPGEIQIPLSDSGRDYVNGIKLSKTNSSANKGISERSKELKKEVDAEKKKQKQDDKLAKKVDSRNTEVEEEILRLRQIGKDRAKEAILKNLAGEISGSGNGSGSHGDTGGAVAYSLKVKAIEAKDLMALDAGGTSDPYVIFKIEKVLKKTKVKKRTCNPVWNQIVEFDLPSDFDTSMNVLEVQLMDEDKFSKDDSLGTCVLDLGDLKARADKEPIEVWLDLKGVAHGKVHLELSLYEN